MKEKEKNIKDITLIKNPKNDDGTVLPGRSKYFLVTERSAPTLEFFITRNVSRSSRIVITDGWGSY